MVTSKKRRRASTPERRLERQKADFESGICRAAQESMSQEVVAGEGAPVRRHRVDEGCGRAFGQALMRCLVVLGAEW